MEERRMPRRYRMDGTGQMRRTWNGKLPEEFNEKDMLLFAIDTDIVVNGSISDSTRDTALKMEREMELVLNKEKHKSMVYPAQLQIAVWILGAAPMPATNAE